MAFNRCRRCVGLKAIVLLVGGIVVLLCVIWTASSDHARNDDLRGASLERRLVEQATTATNAAQKSVIYTFYSPLLRVPPDSQREQHIRQADEALLAEWKLAWSDAGYEPRVLSLEQAQQHPLYDEILSHLNSLTLLGEGGRNREYNEYCFLRFLAMAVAGGGLMADYDLVPLNMPVSNLSIEHSPDFVIYSEALNGSGGIPCLASGTASEWTRIAMAMVDLTKRDDMEFTQWSDMVALMKLFKQAPNTYILENHVVGAKDFARGQQSHLRWSCPPGVQNQRPIWAMHFSHYDVMAAGHRVPSRAKLIQEYRQWWKINCDRML